MDYYLSSELLEIEGATEHYTEELVRLRTLPTYYYRPPLPPIRRTRDHFGLADYDHLYLCPQTLLKFHPDFDRPISEILRRDPHGRLILIEGKYPYWTGLLRSRFEKTMPDVLDRVWFLPRQNRAEFLSLIALSDVLLDPFHFGGGNTTYEALAVGTPIVTWPATYMRGRVTFACYQKMGFFDCVASDAEDYVDTAVRLGADQEYRDSVRHTIRAASNVLFEDMEAVRELEQFFQYAVEVSRGMRGGTSGIPHKD
jgi:predicted O-linked N-acetylglucosamine transferase (SPINDLY family)